jgi:hypothetical protein
MRRLAWMLLIVVTTSCGKATWVADQDTQLVFLTREGCVNTQTMRTHLGDALRVLAWPVDYQVLDLATLADTDVRKGYPTPTLLFANRDLFGMPEPRRPLPEPT